MKQQFENVYDDNYNLNREFSDGFVSEVKKILAEFFLIEAPLIEDLKQNTDIRSFVMWPIRYGFRIRRHRDINFNKDFTIYYESPKGKDIEVEFHKMLKGYGDYFLYGFADQEEISLECWGICDLRILRGFIECYASKHNGELPGRIMKKYGPNREYLGKFIAFNWEDLPPSGVYAYKNLPISQDKCIHIDKEIEATTQ